MSASARLLRTKKQVNYKPAPLNRSLTLQGDTVTVDVQGAKPEVSPNHRDKVVTEDGRVFFPCPYCSRAFTDKVNRAIHLNTCPAKSYILSVASAARTDDMLGPKSEKEDFIDESGAFDKPPSFCEEEQRAFMQAVQLAKVNEIISDDDGKTVVTRMTYNKRALQKAKLVAALSATFHSSSDDKQLSPNIPKTSENESNSETKSSPIKPEVKKSPVGSDASEKNKLPSANKKPAMKKGATNLKKTSSQQKSKSVPSKSVSKKAVSASASKKPVKSVPSQKLKVAPKKSVKKNISSRPVVKVKLKKVPVPRNVVKKVTPNKQSKPNSQSKGSKKVTVKKSPTKTKSNSIKATPSKGSKNNVPKKQTKITTSKVASNRKSISKNSNTKSVKPIKVPKLRKTMSKQIVIGPSIGMKALERKISDLVNLMSGGGESKSPKLTLKKDAKTGSLVITSEVQPTENKTPTKRPAQESHAAPKRKKVKSEPLTDAVDADSNKDNVTNKQVVPEAQEKLISSTKMEVPFSETEFKVKVEECQTPVNKKVSNKSKKSTNNSSSKQVKEVEKAKSKIEPTTRQRNVSPKKSGLPKIVLKNSTSRKVNTRVNKKKTSTKTKNNINITQTKNVQSRKPALKEGNKDDKPKRGKVTKPTLKTLDQRKLKSQVDNMTEQNAKDTSLISLSKEATGDVKQLTLDKSMLSPVEVDSKQTQKLSKPKVQKNKVSPNKADHLLVLDITGPEDDIENDGYKHATENIVIPIIESYSGFSEPSAKTKNTLLQKRAEPENVQKRTRVTRTTSNLKQLSRKSLNTPQTPKQSTSEAGKENKLKIDQHVIKIDDDIIDLDDEIIEVDEELPENKKVLEGTETSSKPLTDEELLSLLALRDDVQVECIIQKPVTQGRSSLPPKSAALSQSKSVVSTRSIRSTSATPVTLRNIAKTTDNVASTSKIDRTSLIQELILNNIPKDDMHPKKLESYFRQLAMNLATSNAKQLSAGTTRTPDVQIVAKQKKNEDDPDVAAVCSGEPAVVNLDAEADGVEMDPLLLEEEEEEDEGANRSSDQASAGPKSDMTCKYCLQVFDTAIECLRHKRQMHMFPKILLSTSKLQEYMNATDYSQCPICHRPIKLHPGCTSRNRNAYQKHLRTHSKDTHYACSKCHKKFKREDYMKIHEKRHY